MLLLLQDDINPPSAVIAINSVASSKVGRQKTFEFLKENYDKIFERYKVSMVT